MIPISSGVGFWILDAYRRIGSQLHLRGKIAGEFVDCSSRIEMTLAIDSKICLRLFDCKQGQKTEWTVWISISEAAFRFSPSGDAKLELQERHNSALELSFPSGDVLVMIESPVDRSN